MHFTNLPIGISVVMSKGIGPRAFKIDIPTIAKMVKKTNLQNSFKDTITCTPDNFN